MEKTPHITQEALLAHESEVRPGEEQTSRYLSEADSFVYGLFEQYDDNVNEIDANNLPTVAEEVAIATKEYVKDEENGLSEAEKSIYTLASLSPLMLLDNQRLEKNDNAKPGEEMRTADKKLTTGNLIEYNKAIHRLAENNPECSVSELYEKLVKTCSWFDVTGLMPEAEIEHSIKSRLNGIRAERFLKYFIEANPRLSYEEASVQEDKKGCDAKITGACGTVEVDIKASTKATGGKLSEMQEPGRILAYVPVDRASDRFSPTDEEAKKGGELYEEIIMQPAYALKRKSRK